jgi:Rrf2 family cysteine metabolism transcriptional repressor
MIKISKRAQYGLRAMVYLAKNYRSKKICSIKTISEKEGIPFDFLEKIILQLEKEKLVIGKKGVKGGYILYKNPKGISVNDIVATLENNIKSVDCSCCGRKNKCLTKNVWVKVNFALNKTLESITLESLIK